MTWKSHFLAAMASSLLAASQSYAQTSVDLGTAGTFAILAKSGISSTGITTIVGNIGVSPIGASGITGFGLVLDASNVFSTSALVTGQVFAADYSPPTPANLTTAVSNMETAYTDAAGRAASVTELGAGNIGGMTLAPGVYSWSTGLTIPTDVTLAGGPNGVWIFQIAGTLGISSGTRVILRNGAQAKNIFWQVAGQTTLGTTSQFKGVILDQTAIVMNTGATLDGRALAQTAVTLDSNAVNSQQATSGQLADGFYAIESSADPNDNTCVVGASGTAFEAFGDVQGGTTPVVVIHYDTPQPTTVSRSSKKISVKQSQFSTLNVLFDGASVTGGPQPIEKCSVSGSVNTTKSTGSTKVNCSGKNLFGGLTANQAGTVQSAFNGNKNAKFKFNTNGKWSLSIKCNGDVSAP